MSGIEPVDLPDDVSFLERIRLKELDVAVGWMPAGSAVLELGAGSGWQARRLASLGFAVSAIDVPVSNYKAARVWPIVDYDGRKIPFPDASFDVVFSSNVLEHIPHVESFQHEIKRVLRPGGVAVHLVPTATWRWWTSLAHYPFLAGRLLALGAGGARGHALTNEIGARARQRGVLGLIGRALIAPRHGEAGGPVTELYYFSRLRWDRLFERAGWRVRRHTYNRLFYTGYGLMAERLPLHSRAALSAVLGSSCHLYVLEDRPARR